MSKLEAIELYQLTLNSNGRALGGKCSRIIVTRHNLALELEMIGNYEEAAQHWRFVLASRANYTESPHPELSELMVKVEEHLGYVGNRASK